MADLEDIHFETGDSGVSTTYPMHSSDLRENGFVMLKNRPCKIIKIEKQAEDVHLFGIDIFTNQMFEDISPSTQSIEVPHVKREDYQLTDISDDNSLVLMSDRGELREDLKVPDGDLGNQLRNDYQNGKDLLCTVLKACNEEFIIAIKNNTVVDK